MRFGIDNGVPYSLQNTRSFASHSLPILSRAWAVLASIYDKRTDPAFSRLWDEALDIAADTPEDEARKRAFAGGDVLLMFLLKGIRPQRESRSTMPPAELNKMIEAELACITKQREVEALGSVN